MANSLRESVNNYCAKIGSDSKLVQGAGGNVSWKDGGMLWVKASGTWLAEANEKNIFVPIELSHFLSALNNNEFSIAPLTIGENQLRPSIESMLHALMPQRVVVHLHAVEVLAHLVRKNFLTDLTLLLGKFIPWAFVDYVKPGISLGLAIRTVLIEKPTTQIIFLKNHGVVVGGADIAEVDNIISKLVSLLRADLTFTPQIFSIEVIEDSPFDEYVPVNDVEIQHLALNPTYFKRLSSDWALYPDHVVFLGARAYTYQSWEMFSDKQKVMDQLPELVFISGVGVYKTKSFNNAKEVQLRCYFDVIARQKSKTLLSVLSNTQVAELLNWDAEQYRKSLEN